MGMMEKWMKSNPNATAQDFPQKVPAFIFNELKNNNIIANAFLDQDRSEDPTLDQLISDGSLIYDLGLDDYEFTTYRQHIIDLNNEIEKNGENRKVLVKARGYAKNTERNFQIISNLNKHDMIDEQRPLTFYPNSKKKRLFIGSEEKNNFHNVVPFEFVGKKLYYGLTATGTSDLNPMPFDPRYPMVGLHANALNTILDNKIIYEVPEEHIALVIFAIALLLAFGVPALSAALGGLATAIIAVSYTHLTLPTNREV